MPRELPCKLVALFDRATRKEYVIVSLTVEHINKSFAQVQAIKDLSMEMQEGAIFGFLGANGLPRCGGHW